jgi:hypothetical protein
LRKERTVRYIGLALAAAAGMASGCSELAPELRLPPAVFKLDTWTDVPDGQAEVEAKVGDVLHLPLGAGADCPPLSSLKARVNDRAQDQPEFYTGGKVPCYVFRAAKAGRYRVEIGHDLVRRVDAWREWVITVTE